MRCWGSSAAVRNLSASISGGSGNRDAIRLMRGQRQQLRRRDYGKSDLLQHLFLLLPQRRLSHRPATTIVAINASSTP